MHRGRIAEHVRTVADCADHRLLRRGELRAERRAHAPAQPARRRVAEVAARLADHHLLEHRRVLVHQDGLVVEKFVQARGEPLAGDLRRHGLDAGARFFPDVLRVLGDDLLSLLDLLH